MASEDIGNADPRALQIVLDAWETYERVGNSRERIYLGASCSLLRLVHLKQCKFIKPSMPRAMMPSSRAVWKFHFIYAMHLSN
ncbi:hypothetical protein [Candidatus Coxiella mudrowiae]|uniref:AAA family ATPase n=1 Tax=Candidatus Coxiella mudrowiae TaxID=2054173 RepID=UPI001F450FE1|nr:hypothetical protein [Candidatus Coxiella mudrowiae]